MNLDSFIMLYIFKFLALPFAITHPAVSNIYEAKLSDGVTPAWYGEVAPQDWGVWVDYAFLLLLGGIPWQCYYQASLQYFVNSCSYLAD